MNGLRILFLSCVLVVCSFTVSFASPLTDVRVQAGLNFDYWGDNKDNHAAQLYTPVTISGRLQEFSFSVLTAYSYTSLHRSGVGNVSLSHPLDSKLNFSYGVIDKLPFDILFGLDFNLPTGKTNLSARQLSLIMDPDLISINNFGEGFNVNPTVTIAKEWGKWVGALGLGYLWRGSYDFSSQIGIKDYQPGAIYNVNSELRYFFSSAASARFFAGHAWYGADTVEHTRFFQPGDFTQLGVGLNYAPAKKWDTGAVFRVIFRDKSKFQAAPGEFVTESRDSQGDEWILDLMARYLLNAKTSVRGVLQGRYFTENGYSSNSAFYVGKREKVSLGIGMTRALTDKVGLGLDVKGFFKHDDRANYPEPLSARDYWGYSLSIMITGTF